MKRLLAHIKAAHAGSKGEYGWPRIWKELHGLRVGKERIQRLMKLHGIKVRGKCKFVVTTDSKHNLPIAPNLLNRDFQPAQPNAVWASDITYIQTDEGWLYLAAVIDLYSRQVVGWSMQLHMQTSRGSFNTQNCASNILNIAKLLGQNCSFFQLFDDFCQYRVLRNTSKHRSSTAIFNTDSPNNRI